MKKLKIKKQGITFNFKLSVTFMIFLILAGAFLVFVFTPKVNARLDVEWGAVYIMTNQPYTIDKTVDIEGFLFGDTEDVTSVSVNYKIGLLGSWKDEPASHIGGDYYRGSIPPTDFSVDDTIYYRMTAYSPDDSEQSFESSFIISGISVDRVWHSPDPADYTDLITVKATITGNSEIDAVKCKDEFSGTEYIMSENLYGTWETDIGTLSTDRFVTVTVFCTDGTLHSRQWHIFIIEEEEETTDSETTTPTEPPPTTTDPPETTDPEPTKPPNITTEQTLFGSLGTIVFVAVVIGGILIYRRRKT